MGYEALILPSLSLLPKNKGISMVNNEMSLSISCRETLVSEVCVFQANPAYDFSRGSYLATID